MLRQFDPSMAQVLEDWYQEFPPADITIHNLKTGAQIREPSLVAVVCKKAEFSEQDLYTGETRTVARTVPDRVAAVGRAALDCRNAPDTVVFSPFRRGQVAHYHAAQLLIRSLLGQVCPGSLVLKPVMCIHIQKHTTQVEEQALVEAAIQAGARKVLLYSEPLSAILDAAPSSKPLRHAVIMHIEPREEGRHDE